MARRTSLVSLNQISDINMTPLMDLTFILLITFIITFPLIEQGISINLPKGQAQELPEVTSVAIALDARGKLYVDERAVTEEELLEVVSERVAQTPELTLFLRADQSLSYGEVMRLMQLFHQADLHRIALISEVSAP
jgi:biopolymer transport protein TolR